MSGHKKAQDRPSEEEAQSASEAAATSTEENSGADAGMDGDIDFDEDSPEVDAYLIARADEARKEGHLSAEKTMKRLLECLVIPDTQEADMDEDIDFDEDSPILNAYWIGRAEQAGKEGHIGAEKTMKQLLECLVIPDTQEADMDEDIDFDEDSPEVDACWVARAEEARKEGHLSAEESMKEPQECLVIPDTQEDDMDEDIDFDEDSPIFNAYWIGRAEQAGKEGHIGAERTMKQLLECLLIPDTKEEDSGEEISGENRGG